MIDCLKEKNRSFKEITASIDKFQLYCISNDLKCDELIKFMRNLQSLRSFDVAHRKSSDIKKRVQFLEYFDYYDKTQQDVLENIFSNWIVFLQKLVTQL